MTLRKISPLSQVLLPAWLLFSATAGLAQSPIESNGIDPKVIVAWEKAGAEHGWFVRDSSTWPRKFFSNRPADVTALPGFQVKDSGTATPKIKDLLAALKDLPEPDRPFALSLNDRIVDNIVVKQLARFKKVAALYLYYSGISNEGLADLSQLKELRILDLGDTNVGDTGLKPISELKELRALLLANTQVTDAGLKNLASMTQLEDLSLGGTKITGAGLKSLENLKQLRSLNLNSTSIDDAGLKTLVVFKNLERLGLYGVNLTDAGLAELHNLKSLKHLSLGTFTGSEKARQELKRVLPDLEIK